MRSARSSDKGWCRTFGEIVVSRSRPPELMREDRGVDTAGSTLALHCSIRQSPAVCSRGAGCALSAAASRRQAGTPNAAASTVADPRGCDERATAHVRLEVFSRRGGRVSEVRRGGVV